MSGPTNIGLALAAFTMFFATVGPVDCAVIFASLTSKQSRASQSRMALKACAIATGVLAVGAVSGKFILTQLGVSLPALQGSGGIILLLIALDMVFARPHGTFTITGPETSEARHKDASSSFPWRYPFWRDRERSRPQSFSRPRCRGRRLVWRWYLAGCWPS